MPALNVSARTWLRGVLPAWACRFFPKVDDCGDHDWYSINSWTKGCYHCHAHKASDRGVG